MKPEVYQEIHRLSHDDDRRYQLLMRRLRIIYTERKTAGLAQKLKRQWNAKKSKNPATGWK